MNTRASRPSARPARAAAGPFASAAATVALERRDIERPFSVVSVLAPSAWPDAQVEAWLDWADTFPERDADAPLGGGPAAWAARTVEAARGRGMGQAEARRLAGELAATMLLGLAAPGAATEAPLLLGDAAALAAWRGNRRRDRLAAGAASALAGRLEAVRDAVDRCEGPRADCASPYANPALAAALREARAAGADDGLLQDALAAAATGAPPPPLALEPAVEALAVTCDAMDAAWETGRAVCASTAPAACAAASGMAAPRVAVRVRRADLDGGGEALAAAELFAGAMRAAGGTAAVTPAGLHEALVACGHAFDSSPAVTRTAGFGERWRAVTGAPCALFDDAGLSLRLGGAALGAAPRSGRAHV